ncbi:hypothetical protein PG993_007424 [Apiospora rasikravindrae]|uniref:NmrA-like domain-containing protein n=1 Tax=Apiospora rasikravindrae TaxID=990691 RepID=A0ABR1SXH2_9PEZI
MSSTPRTFLIVGATGQQGGAVLTALSKLLSEGHHATTPPPKVLALTRSAPDSPKAQALTSKYPVLDLTVVQGDTKDPAPIFAAHPDISSVFMYTTPPDEEGQALPLLDHVFFSSPDSSNSGSSKVHHIVFSSVDRGGDTASWENPTEIAHFRSKHEIEVRLRDFCAQKASQKVKYTILRPVAFMDNLNPGSLFGPVFASMWATMPAEKPLQVVSVRDIGLFGAKALLAGAVGDDGKWSNKAIGLAGQELRFEEAREIFRRASGGLKEMPQAPWVVGKGVRWAIGEVGTMFRFFEEEGYGVDIDALRRQEPELQDLEMWLRESSKFEFNGAS